MIIVSAHDDVHVDYGRSNVGPIVIVSLYIIVRQKMKRHHRYLELHTSCTYTVVDRAPDCYKIVSYYLYSPTSLYSSLSFAGS